MVTDAHFWDRRAKLESWVRRKIAMTVFRAGAEYVMEDCLDTMLLCPDKTAVAR